MFVKRHLPRHSFGSAARYPTQGNRISPRPLWLPHCPRTIALVGLSTTLSKWPLPPKPERLRLDLSLAFSRLSSILPEKLQEPKKRKEFVATSHSTAPCVTNSPSCSQAPSVKITTGHSSLQAGMTLVGPAGLLFAYTLQRCDQLRTTTCPARNATELRWDFQQRELWENIFYRLLQFRNSGRFVHQDDLALRRFWEVNHSSQHREAITESLPLIFAHRNFPSQKFHHRLSCRPSICAKRWKFLLTKVVKEWPPSWGGGGGGGQLHFFRGGFGVRSTFWLVRKVLLHPSDAKMCWQRWGGCSPDNRLNS